MKVKDSLGIIWLYEDGTGGEVAGITFHGYCRENNPTIDINSLESLWTLLKGEIHTRISVIPECDTFEIVDSGSITTCDVRLDHWPDDKEWRGAVEETLRMIANSEGSVAWCGGMWCG